MNISFIGMMGSGKSCISKILSQKLPQFSFVDIDELIVIKEKMPIVDIFKTKGEVYFRQLESEILKDVLSKDNQIVSTGGGIILNPENIDALKEHSVVFFLSANSETLFLRLKNNSDRPLLNNCDMQKKISVLLSERSDKYKQAHYTIVTDNLTPEDIADEVIGKLGLNGSTKS